MSDGQEKPPRLIEDPAYREALSAVKNEPGMSDERLDRNLRSITPTISQPPPAGPSLATTVLTLAGIGGLFAIVWVALPALFPNAVPESTTPTPIADVASPAETPEVSLPPPGDTPVAPRTVAPTTPLATETPSISVADPGETPVPATGTLAQELALYEEARASAKSGDHAGALAKLDELARRFPVTTLAPEAAITRAEVLVKAKRLDDASALLSKLVADPVHAGRRAELERTLGDVERERGDCTSARLHYRAALDAGATGDEASAVRRGLGMCEAQ